MSKRALLLVLLLGLAVGGGGGFLLGSSRGPQPATPAQASVPKTELRVLDAVVHPREQKMCFEFDRVLAARPHDDFKQFVRVEPAAAVTANASGRTLCVGGFNKRGDYKLQLLPGLPAADGKTLAAVQDHTAAFGQGQPRITFVGRGFVLPRVGAVGLPIETENVDKLRVRVLRVVDRNLVQQMGRYWWRGPLTEWDGASLERVGTVVWEGSLSVVDKQADKPVTTSFPLTDILPERLPGAYLVTAEPWHKADRYDGPRATQWVVDTDVTLTTFRGEADLSVFARSLDSAKPLAGVDVLLVAEGGKELARTRTDASGSTSFAAGLLNGSGSDSARALLAIGPNQDFTVHDLTRPGFDLTDRGVAGRASPGPIDAFVWSDRGVYRPGETLHLSVMMRDRLARAVDTPARISIVRPNGGEWEQRVVRPDAAGGAHVSVELPAAASRGLWQALVRTDPKAEPIGRISFEVQDFVPQRMAVEAAASLSVATAGEPLGVTLRGTWLYGAPAADLATEVRAKVDADPDPFPRLKGWRFGLLDDAFRPEQIDFEAARTDAEGAASATVTPAIGDSSRPLRMTITGSVFEPGGRPNPAVPMILPVAGNAVFLGIKPEFEGGRVINGAEAAVKLLAVDRSGTAVPQAGVRWQLVEEDWRYLWSREEGQWQHKITIIDGPSRAGSIDLGGEPAILRFATKPWTRYRLVLTSADGKAAASLRFAAGWRQSSPDQDEAPDMLSVVPDKDRYTVGEVARVTIKPQFPGQALVTVATAQPTETRHLTIPVEGVTIDLPVQEAWGAGTYVIVNHHRPLAAEGVRGPVRAVGVAWLGIDNAARTLAVELAPPDVVRPDTTLRIPIKVAGLKPGANAVVTVAAVDEGILALTRFESPAPERFYFGKRRLGVVVRDDYGRLLDSRAAPAGRIRHGGDETGGKGLSVVPTRTVALFSGPVALGADGTGVVELPIPDFNGKLRLMAVAYAADAVGHGVASTLVRHPVLADAFFPRFVAPDDQARMTLRLHNIEGPPGPYRIELRTDGVTALSGRTVIDANLAKDGRHLELLNLSARDTGIGDIALRLTGPDGLDIRRNWQIQARSPHYPLTLEQTAPLAPGEAFAIAPALLQAFLPGSARITVGLGHLRGIDVPALLASLDRYPYGCTEQTVSRAMPLLAYDDPALLATAGVVPAPAELRQRVQKAIDVLVDRQGEDGAIGLWKRDDDYSSSWLVGFATDFLLQAREHGYRVPDDVVERANNWLKGQAQAYRRPPRGDYSKEDTAAGQAYASYLLARSKRPLPNLDELVRRSDLAPLPRAMVAAALAMGGRRQDAERLFNEARASVGQEHHGSASLYPSPVRDLAAVLALAVESKAGLDVAPLIERLGREVGPVDKTNTQEKAWLLRAVSRLTTDEPIDVEAGGVLLAGGARKGALLLTPTLEQLQSGWQVANRGKREVYRTLTIHGAPKQAPPPLAGGFELTKTVYDATGAELDLSSGMRQHDRVVVSLTGKLLDSTHRQSLLVDMLPAGWEIEQTLAPPRKDEQPAFAWLEPLSPTRVREARDDRFVAAFDLNEPASSSFDWDEEGGEAPKRLESEFHVAYVARAVTSGRFVLPAAVVEDMYRPAVMARTAAGTVEIAGE